MATQIRPHPPPKKRNWATVARHIYRIVDINGGLGKTSKGLSQLA